jgi:ABC-type Fe3+-siderophore transport system permease subunit
MPSTLSVLPWWGWFLCALAFRFVSWLFSTLYGEARYSGRSSKLERASERTLAAVFLITALLCGVVGLIGFVKWAWMV